MDGPHAHATRIAQYAPTLGNETSLDPPDWQAMEALGHRMLVDIFRSLRELRDGPVWQPMPPDICSAWDKTLPREPMPAEAVYEKYLEQIAPYGTGNRHPRFMGWVHGGGSVIGILAEMLAAGLNANLGGRDHAPIACEQQVIRWSAEMLGFPADASGLLVTGTSMANLIAVLVARTKALGADVRKSGPRGHHLIAYAAASAHGCIARALDIAGVGTQGLRLIACNDEGGIDLAALDAAISVDVIAGQLPFLVVGTAGSVDTGAIDDLDELASLCAVRQLWFHVDAATVPLLCCPTPCDRGYEA